MRANLPTSRFPARESTYLVQRQLCMLVLCCTGILCSPSSFSAGDSGPSGEAILRVIRDTAADICTAVPIEGSQSSLQLTGVARLKLAGGIAKVADLGLKGAAKYNSESYSNVLQKDLATAIKNGNDCRLIVFSTLQAKMLPTGDHYAKEDADFRTAISMHSADGYRGFLALYSAGPHAAVVRQKLAACRTIGSTKVVSRETDVSADATERGASEYTACDRAHRRVKNDMKSSCVSAASSDPVLRNESYSDKTEFHQRYTIPSEYTCETQGTANCTWNEQVDETREECP